MATDIDRLGARLRVSWTALLIAAGCSGSQSTAESRPEAPQVDAAEKIEAEVKPALETPVEVKPVAVEPVVPVAEKPEVDADGNPKPPKPPPGEEVGLRAAPNMSRPTCPSGTWTTTAALAVKVQQKQLGAAEVKGECPASVGARPRTLTEEEKKELAKLPPHGSNSLDADATSAAGAGNCVYRWHIPCPGGRVLVGEDGVVLAEVRDDAAWCDGDVVGGGIDARLAEAWLMDARVEHASIASFARATIELLALAAPPALVHATQAASLDEVEHARVCFALASRYAGTSCGPGPLPAVTPRAADLVRLACDVLIEGCVGETIAALAATRGRRGCADEVVSAALGKIADDEARHAALAWATLGWACERGGEAVREAVRVLAAGMRREVFAEEVVVAEVDAEELARHGRLDAAGQRACVVDAWDSLIPRALAEVVG